MGKLCGLLKLFLATPGLGNVKRVTTTSTTTSSHVCLSCSCCRWDSADGHLKAHPLRPHPSQICTGLRHWRRPLRRQQSHRISSLPSLPCESITLHRGITLSNSAALRPPKKTYFAPPPQFPPPLHTPSGPLFALAPLPFKEKANLPPWDYSIPMNFTLPGLRIHAPQTQAFSSLALSCPCARLSSPGLRPVLAKSSPALSRPSPALSRPSSQAIWVQYFHIVDVKQAKEESTLDGGDSALVLLGF